MNDGGGGYERAHADPVFRAAFEAAYRGDADPLDALWWHEHPGVPSPAGVADPDAELAALRRSLYAPGADDGVRAAYERASAAAASRGAATEAAVRAAEAAIAPRDAEAPAPQTPAAVPSRRRMGRPLLAVVAVVTVVGLSAAIAALGSPGMLPAPQPTTTETISTFTVTCAAASCAVPSTVAINPFPLWLVGRGAADLAPPTPTTAGKTLASALGTTSGARSPDLNAGGEGIIVGVACVGDGAVDVQTTDGAKFHFTCSSPQGANQEHRDYGSHRRFAFSVKTTGTVKWAINVASVDRG